MAQSFSEIPFRKTSPPRTLIKPLLKSPSHSAHKILQFVKFPQIKPLRHTLQYYIVLANNILGNQYFKCFFAIELARNAFVSENRAKLADTIRYLQEARQRTVRRIYRYHEAEIYVKLCLKYTVKFRRIIIVR